MHYFEYPSVDATIYQASQSMNTGLDPILEVRKDVSATGDTVNVSRALVKFDLTYISSSVISGLIPSTAKYYLNMYDANPEELTTSDILYAHPVSQSWTGGTGEFDSNPQITNGVSWKYSQGKSSGQYWMSGSLSGSGATWYSGSDTPLKLDASQSYNHSTTDMRMNVTDIMNAWIYSGSTYPNEGFLVKRSGSLKNADTSQPEGSTTHLGNFSFFSRDTNTIYSPKLEAVWDDSSWSTGSLQPITGSDYDDMAFYVKGLRSEYKQDSKTKIRVVGRARYPEKTYATTPTQLGVKYLPSGSTYYSIKDAQTEEVIIPFGSGSIVSCDSTGNYFNLWLNGLQPERIYNVQFKATVSQSTSNEQDVISLQDHTFKVSR